PAAGVWPAPSGRRPPADHAGDLRAEGSPCPSSDTERLRDGGERPSAWRRVDRADAGVLVRWYAISASEPLAGGGRLDGLLDGALLHAPARLSGHVQGRRPAPGDARHAGAAKVG